MIQQNKDLRNASKIGFDQISNIELCFFKSQLNKYQWGQENIIELDCVSLTLCGFIDTLNLNLYIKFLVLIIEAVCDLIMHHWKNLFIIKLRYCTLKLTEFM